MTLRLNTADQDFEISFKKLIDNDRGKSQDVSNVVSSILEKIKNDVIKFLLNSRIN